MAEHGVNELAITVRHARRARDAIAHKAPFDRDCPGTAGTWS